MTARAALEIGAVVLTTALYFVAYEVLHARGAFIAAAVAGWGVYLGWRCRSAEARRELGLARAGLGPSAAAAAAIFVVGAAACAIVGFASGTGGSGTGITRGTLAFTPSMLPVAFLYPIWGLFQQVLVLGMVVRHLDGRLPRLAVIAIAGALFGAIHLPQIELAGATALLGAAFAAIFLRWRNVWPLGLCHGWLGVLFYPWVLGRDPWREIVG